MERRDSRDKTDIMNQEDNKIEIIIHRGLTGLWKLTSTKRNPDEKLKKPEGNENCLRYLQ